MLPNGPSRLQWILLILSVAALYLFQLGTRGLNEPDEGRYANIALEALEPDHPWWEPQLADIGHYDKPPLTYWLSALGYEIFGVNEWGARLPSFIGAMATLGGITWFAFRMYGSRVAWATLLVAGTLFQIWLWGRILSCDMLLAGWCTLAIAAWAETRNRQGSLLMWLLQLIFWTLAGWTKATPALVPLLGLALFVYGGGSRDDRRALRLPLLLPLIVLLSLPWYVIILFEHPALQNFFLHREIGQRIVGHISGHAGPIYYYIPLCLLFWLPWWPLAVAAWIRTRPARTRSLEPWYRQLSPGFYIAAVGFIVFSLIGSKHATYLLPFAPWAALEMARYLEREHTWFQPAVLSAIAGATALLYCIGVSLAPNRESHWGIHSSLREVSVALHQQHADGVYADHFWPSLEVYCGEEVRFIENPPQEVFDKADKPDEHFGFTLPASRQNRWFIHYRKSDDAPFKAWLANPKIPKTYVGDFVIGPIRG